MLAQIVAHHRARVADDPRPVEALYAAARAAAPPRDFAGALRGAGLSLIAEVKRRSPSKGDIAPNLDAGALARAYADGGASCLSVLTDEHYFGGSLDDLAVARRSSGLPTLRKDFTVSPQDVCEARLAGADAVLLIVAALSDEELRSYVTMAADLEMAALVEAHDEGEVERAVDSGSRIIGVNQRDLKDFAVDPARAARVAGAIPEGVLKVAESGIAGPDDAARAADAGYDAVLVGEYLVSSADPTAAARGLVAACS